jgi:hypothetical protein
MKKLLCIGDWQLLELDGGSIIHHDCSEWLSASPLAWPLALRSALRSRSAWRSKKCYYCGEPVSDEILALYVLHNDLI